MSNEVWERPQNQPEDRTSERPQRGFLVRIRDWFRRPSPKRDSYVSNVTNPDDRRFMPRR